MDSRPEEAMVVIEFTRNEEPSRGLFLNQSVSGILPRDQLEKRGKREKKKELKIDCD